MVQDRKAIQAGTSHFLGQNFAQASGIRFQNREGRQEFGWTTSWGLTTRMVGTVVMMHSDDDGAVLPPRIAPTQIVILPITPKEQTRAAVLEACDKVAARLSDTRYAGAPIEVLVDRRDLGGGVKNWEWIKKGVPIRIEIGPRDLAQGTAAISCRGKPHRERSFVPTAELPGRFPSMLDEIQSGMLARATAFRDSQTRIIESKEQFYEFFTPQNAAKPEIHGGFALAYWGGSAQLEEEIKDKFRRAILCMP